ncbi:MAG TPA: hypothetical protein PKA10_07705 [Selenomonadales bacterium]|nr:hypothetical protein [Selenomonadales bacterium]
MNAQDTFTAVARFLAALNELEEHWSRLYDDIGQTDLETQDFLHEVELTKFSAYEGYDIASKFQAVRKRRRAAKDEQEILGPLKQWLDKHKTLTIDLYKVIGAMEKTIEQQRSRHYRPRIRTDLKICRGAAEESDATGT